MADQDYCFTVTSVSQFTGLSCHVIRMWERRYQAVAPARTPGGSRLYSSEDVERLKLLRDLTKRGHRISLLAGFNQARLEAILTGFKPRGTDSEAGTRDGSLDECVKNVRLFNSTGLMGSLQSYAFNLGLRNMLSNLLCPFLRLLRSQIQAGTISRAQKHFALEVTRDFMMAYSREQKRQEAGAANALIVSAFSGLPHEVVALATCALAVEANWNPRYFGVDMPPLELAYVTKSLSAAAVAVAVSPRIRTSIILEFFQELRLLLPDTKIYAVCIEHETAFNEDLAKFDIEVPDGEAAMWKALNSTRDPSMS